MKKATTTSNIQFSSLDSELNLKLSNQILENYKLGKYEVTKTSDNSWNIGNFELVIDTEKSSSNDYSYLRIPEKQIQLSGKYVRRLKKCLVRAENSSSNKTSKKELSLEEIQDLEALI